MERAWGEVGRLDRVNAVHRKGWRLGDANPVLSLKNAAQELVELAGAPDDITELADLFGCLVVDAVKEGWSSAAVEDALLKKLAARFEG
jgi:Protein of unknown function (DUF550)